MRLDKNIQTFVALIRAGLWENSHVQGDGLMVNGSSNVDWKKVYRLATEQSVLGLVLAGIDWFKVHDLQFMVPQELLLQWIGEVQIIEQQNVAMNEFLAKLINQLRNQDVYALLVKGPGIAQCYKRPLWRSSGDVDLLLSDANYEKAKKILIPLAIDVNAEFKSLKHLGMTMKEGYVVELHGLLHSRLSGRIDKTIDEAQYDVFCGGNVRSWQNGGTLIFIPSADNEVIFVFTHILKHFYIEGIGLRQICDWCRLLWTYKDSLNHELLEKRILKMGLMTEWKAFGAFAVEYLGMPIEAMPLYDVSGKKEDVKWKKKAERIMEFVLETGNFGHNRSFKRSNNYLIGIVQAFVFKLRDFVRHARLFPVDSLKFFLHYIVDGIQQASATKPVL